MIESGFDKEIYLFTLYTKSLLTLRYKYEISILFQDRRKENPKLAEKKYNFKILN